MASRRHRFWASGLGLAMKSHAARSSVAASAPAATPLLTDLIAYWDLDETSGTRADSHTNGLDLTDKAERVRHYAENLRREVEIIAHACGAANPRQLRREHCRIVVGPGRSVPLNELYRPAPARRLDAA